MTISLTLVCAHPADATWGHALPRDCDIDGASTVLTTLGPDTSAVRSPTSRCARIAAALALRAAAEPALRDLDYGAWRGRTAADIVAADPYGYSAWLTDPDAAPHGGESIRRLCHRTALWLTGLPPDTGHALAVVEPAVWRALLVHALAAPARAFWQLRISPLHDVCLTRRGDVWSIRPATIFPAPSSGRHTTLLGTGPTRPRRTAGRHAARLCRHACPPLVGHS
ncbi:histidine phosphatase family protein [Streptomyces sp. NPDC053069]|uniref:histidine phosphatase family protein n=1 Tax=Streptomyces sp. NPDC053069 TaxID=3365695 RepID=UPI0037D73AC8